jgi:hypothetical protein
MFEYGGASGPRRPAGLNCANRPEPVPPVPAASILGESIGGVAYGQAGVIL